MSDTLIPRPYGVIGMIVPRQLFLPIATIIFAG